MWPTFQYKPLISSHISQVARKKRLVICDKAKKGEKSKERSKNKEKWIHS
jgi:hypothetical protein